jgi:glycosyltransferase involved in cell wall biosynthesis
MEQVLGHIAYSQNLQRLLPSNTLINPFWLPIHSQMSSWEARIPVYNRNWSVRAGVKVRQSLQQLTAKTSIDGMFVHTQVLGVLIPDWVRRYPTVISLDATPLQYDHLGEAYNHSKDPAWMEQLKFQMNQKMFHLASHISSWTQWAKDSLVSDYGIPGEKITVIPPGVNIHDFAGARQQDNQSDHPVKIIFVGGDFKRKGGYLLLDAFRTLLESHPSGNLELHVLTKSRLQEEPCLFVHRDIYPGDPRLGELFTAADIFVLPTTGDCLPMALQEAGASALPLISTRVGGIPEIVIPGESGFLIDVGDGRGLVQALSRLIEDGPLRRKMGARALQLIRERFDATANTQKLLEVIKAQVDARRNPTSGRETGPIVNT